MWDMKTDTTPASGDQSFRTLEERTEQIHQQYPRQHQHLRSPEDCHPWNSPYMYSEEHCRLSDSSIIKP